MGRCFGRCMAGGREDAGHHLRGRDKCHRGAIRSAGRPFGPGVVFASVAEVFGVHCGVGLGRRGGEADLSGGSALELVEQGTALEGPRPAERRWGYEGRGGHRGKGAISNSKR